MELDHLGLNFIWAVRYAYIIYHTGILSLPFPVPKNSYIGDIILAMEFGEHLSSDKESECFGGRSQVYTGNTPVPRSIDIMREYYDWILMSLPKIKYQTPKLSII